MSVININDYTTIETVLTNPVDYGTYNDLSTAIGDNPDWRLIEGRKSFVNPYTIPTAVIPITEYVQDAVNLTGGVEGYSNVVNVAEGATAGTVAAESAGIFAGWTLGTAVAGVLAGAGIGIAAFELAPEFWTGISNRIFGTDISYDEIKDYTILGRIQNKLVEGQNQVTTYLSTEMVKAILDYAAEYGLFDTTGSYIQDPDNPDLRFYVGVNACTYSIDPTHQYPEMWRWTGNNAIMVFVGYDPEYPDTGVFEVYSKEPLVLTYTYSGGSATQQYGSKYTSTKGRDFYYYYSNEYIFTPCDPAITILPSGYNYDKNTVADLLLYDGETITPTVEGAYVLPRAPIIYDPDKTFEENYPIWIGEEEETSGLINPYTVPETYPQPWLPVTMPKYDPVTQPEKYPKYEPGVEPYPEGLPDSQPAAQNGRLPQTLPDPYQEPTNNIPKSSKNPSTGDPDAPSQEPSTTPTPTPPIVFPTIGGEANALFTVYKPNSTALNSLAGVLWSSGFLDNLMKIFTNNPMDAIISLHMLYATPHTGSNKNIKLGYLDTGISSVTVDKQYIEIDCGTVRIPEYFGDVRDYVNSVVDVYLPFVGMRHLKTQDIIGSYVTIKAGIDVFTGTVLYTINIRKTSGIDQVMYAFEGNCAVALPLTGADKSRMFSVLGAAATGAAAGGVAGAIAGAALSVMNGSQQADIQRTGNFGANSGAMGVKKPYIVVSRNIGYDANNYSMYHGVPSNKSVKLNSCLGFTRVLDINLSVAGATDTELEEIKRLLKEGVII